MLKAHVEKKNKLICKKEAQQNGGSNLTPNPILAENKQKEIENNIKDTANIEFIITLNIFLVSFFISSGF